MNVVNTSYHFFSPQVANFIANHDTTRTPIGIALYSLISILEFSSATYSALASSPELAIVAARVVASALIGWIYLTPIDILPVQLLANLRISSIHVLSVFSLLPNRFGNAYNGRSDWVIRAACVCECRPSLVYTDHGTGPLLVRDSEARH